MSSLRPKMKVPVKPHIFDAMQSMDIDTLGKCSESDLRPVLPGLVRMALCSPLDSSERGASLRKSILIFLSGLEVVNNIVGLLSIDFHSLEQDVKKEQQLRAKSGGNQTESVLIMQLPNGLALEFERSDAARRIRLILSQLLFVVSELKDGRAGNYQKSSELFESAVYLEEVSDILCIAHAELPGLLQLGEVAEALLCLPHGAYLLCQLVANFPESFMEVCTSLVMRGEKVEEDTPGGNRRLHMLKMLAAMNPKDALSIRALCVEHCTMPGLAVSLSLQVSSSSGALGRKTGSDDVVAFVSSLLLGSDSSVRNWFAHFVKAAQKRQREAGRECMLQELRQYLLQRLKDLIPHDGDTLTESSIIPASAIVRLYSALKGIATLKYGEEEMKYLLQMLTSQPPLSYAGTRFVTLAVCVIISSANLLCGSEEEQLMIAWIRQLLAKENIVEVDESSSSFSEILFLVALHFHSNQMSAISELVCNTLGMKSMVKTSSLSRVRHIFMNEIFTEQVIAARAVQMSVTPGLKATHTGYLPIHSILQLLKSRVFSRHKVPIKDWILRQLQKSALPLHPLLPQLMECFVTTILPKGLKVEHTNQPFEEHEILAVYSDFLSATTSSKTPTAPPPVVQSSVGAGVAAVGRERDRGKDNLAPQLLMLYYVLLYLDTLQSVNKSPVLSLRAHVTYSDAVLTQIPINYLVQEAQRRQQHCATIFPALLRLLVTHYPHLCLVEDWMEDSMSLTPTPSSPHLLALAPPTSSGVPLSHAAFKDAMVRVVEKPGLALSQLTSLLQLPARAVHKWADPLVSSLPLLLRSDVPRKVLDLAQHLWFRCHALTPRSLRLATVNALQSRQRGLLKTEGFSEQDVVVDPLVVLRCDERVFRCPPILAIVLRVLSAYIQASRVYLHQQVTTNTALMAAATSTENATKVEKDRMELKNALVAAQESACLQLLLEVCLPLPEEKEKTEGELSCVREVRCAVMSFIHQAFINDPNLAKLLHFQGYPSELLAPMVAGVPSMHICLDFIPELLGQPQVEKQVFGIQLLGELCTQYALPKTMNVARLAINILFTLLSAYESSVWCQVFVQTVPWLVLMCRAFPPLCEDVTSLLVQVARVCRSNLAVNDNTTVTESVKQEGVASKVMKMSKHTNPSPSPSRANCRHLLQMVQDTFQLITDSVAVTQQLY